MLAAVDADQLAGDGAGIEQVAQRGGDVGGIGAALQDGRLPLPAEVGLDYGLLMRDL